MAETYYVDFADKIMVNASDEPCEGVDEGCPCDSVCSALRAGFTHAGHGALPRTLHARIRIASGPTTYLTHLPDVVWDEAASPPQWAWAAATTADRICLTGSSNTDPTVNMDVIEAVDVTCGPVFVTDDLPPAAVGFRTSAGLFFAQQSVDSASVYDPGNPPTTDSFLATWDYGSANAMGFNFVSAAFGFELEIYNDFYLP